MPALARHSTLQTAQLWDATSNVGHREHPSTGRRTTPGPEALQTRSEIWIVFLPVALGHKFAEKFRD